MSITNCNCMKINTAQKVSDCSMFIRSIFFDVLSVFCNDQLHTRSKPIDGVIIVELGISKLLSLEKRFVSIQALLRHNEYRKVNYKKKLQHLDVLRGRLLGSQEKSYVTCKKKPLNALCEKRLQSLMFKWTSFYNF